MRKVLQKHNFHCAFSPQFDSCILRCLKLSSDGKGMEEINLYNGSYSCQEELSAVFITVLVPDLQLSLAPEYGNVLAQTTCQSVEHPYKGSVYVFENTSQCCCKR